MARVAVITPTGFWYDDPSRSTINIEYYFHALRRLGHDVTLYCPEGSRCSDEVVWRIVSADGYQDPAFWKETGAELAIFFCWFQYIEEIRALREAGIRVIARGDSSADSSIRLFPRRNFDYMVGQQTQLGTRLRLGLHFLDCYLRLSPSYDRYVLGIAQEADRIAIETEMARRNLARHLDYYGAPGLVDKVVVCPHLISPDNLTAPLCERKRARVVAIGRWDAYQKDAPLLERALTRFLPAHPESEVVLIGKQATVAFARLAARFPNVKPLETIPRVEIKEHLREAQILVLSSRWETFHIAAHEALCQGATVVGPPVLPVPDIIAAGAFGTMAPNRRPSALAQALADETRAWQSGARDAHEIARFWRKKLDSTAILEHMLAGLAIPPTPS